MAPRNLSGDKMKIIGATIARTRELRGMTRPELARAMGSTTTNIHRMERGDKGGVSLSMLFSIAEALQCSWREVLGPEPGSDGDHSVEWEAGRRAGIGESHEALDKLMRPR